MPHFIISTFIFSLALIAIKVNAQTQPICPAAMDIAFIVDSSGSIDMPSFEKAKDSIKAMVDRFNIGENNARVGLISYSSTVSVVNTFILKLEFWSQAMVKGKVDTLPKLNQNTATGDALYATRTSIFNSARSQVPRLAIVFTDGMSNTGRAVATEAAALKAEGVDVFAVGIGNGKVITSGS